MPVVTIAQTTGAAGFPESATAQVHSSFPWRIVASNTSAGATATNVAVTIWRPSGSRPTTPSAISLSRRQYNTITARIAPDWIVIA